MPRLPRLVLPLLVLLAGCPGPSLMEQVRQMRTFTQCEFRLAEVRDTTLAGVRIQGLTSLADVNAVDAFKLGLALKSGALPLAFSLHVEARNPNPETAAMNRFAWKLFVDGQPVTEGSLDDRVEIGPNGGTAILPLGISVDLRTALAGQGRDAMVNLAFNVAGAGTRPTKLTLKATPTILIAGQPMTFPDAITVTTEFGGR